MPAELRRDAEQERVRALYEEHAHTLLRHARRRSPQLAEDAVSETFAVAVRRAAEIPEGRELPWLYVVLDLTMRNLMRGQRRAGRIAEALQPLTPHAAAPVEPPVVGGALGELPDRERLMLTMTAFEGLSANEAAERIGIPYGSARNALVSGRRRLAVSLAAFGAAMLLVLVIRPMLGGPSAGDRAPGNLKSSIAKAGVIHDVAMVRRVSASATSTVGTRYERWSDPSDDRQRVLLPNGRQIATEAGETLEAAATRIQRAAHGTPISARAREDLAALDAASPSALAGLASDPAAKRSSTAGPTIDGHATTTLRGRVTNHSGDQHAVEATIADDAPDVLRVRAQRLEAGHRVGASSIVDFVQWTPLPPGPDAEATLATTPAPAATRPLATTPAPKAKRGTVRKSTPAAAAAGATIAPRLAPTAGHASVASTAAAPILHVRQVVTTCMQEGTQCRDDGGSELWLELGGKARTHEVRHRDGVLLAEGWRDSASLAYYRVSHNTGRVHTRSTAVLPGARDFTFSEWHGAWYLQLAPELARLAADPAAVAALPPGDLVDGRPTVVATKTFPSTTADMPAWSVGIRLDPSTRLPLQIDVGRDYPAENGHPAMAGERITLRVLSIERIPAGPHARLLSGQFPAGSTDSK
jgi:RNA polymerase sigma-70 factor (ECF subfamily)